MTSKICLLLFVGGFAACRGAMLRKASRANAGGCGVGRPQTPPVPGNGRKAHHLHLCSATFDRATTWRRWTRGAGLCARRPAVKWHPAWAGVIGIIQGARASRTMVADLSRYSAVFRMKFDVQAFVPVICCLGWWGFQF